MQTQKTHYIHAIVDLLNGQRLGIRYEPHRKARLLVEGADHKPLVADVFTSHVVGRAIFPMSSIAALYFCSEAAARAVGRRMTWPPSRPRAR